MNVLLKLFNENTGEFYDYRVKDKYKLVSAAITPVAPVVDKSNVVSTMSYQLVIANREDTTNKVTRRTLTQLSSKLEDATELDTYYVQYGIDGVVKSYESLQEMLEAL